LYAASVTAAHATGLTQRPAEKAERAEKAEHAATELRGLCFLCGSQRCPGKAVRDAAIRESGNLTTGGVFLRRDRRQKEPTCIPVFRPPCSSAFCSLARLPQRLPVRSPAPSSTNPAARCHAPTCARSTRAGAKWRACLPTSRAAFDSILRQTTAASKP